MGRRKEEKHNTRVNTSSQPDSRLLFKANTMGHAKGEGAVTDLDDVYSTQYAVSREKWL